MSCSLVKKSPERALTHDATLASGSLSKAPVIGASAAARVKSVCNIKALSNHLRG